MESFPIPYLTSSGKLCEGLVLPGTDRPWTGPGAYLARRMRRTSGAAMTARSLRSSGVRLPSG